MPITRGCHAVEHDVSKESKLVTQNVVLNICNPIILTRIPKSLIGEKIQRNTQESILRWKSKHQIYIFCILKCACCMNYLISCYSCSFVIWYDVYHYLKMGSSCIPRGEKILCGPGECGKGSHHLVYYYYIWYLIKNLLKILLWINLIWYFLHIQSLDQTP